MGFVSEFKTFAMRGNVLDLAVGVVIGAAFGKIVSALVDGIIMPPVGLLLGGVAFDELAITLKQAVLGPNGEILSAPVLFKYGLFLQSLVDFVLIAFAIFLLVKAVNRFKRREEVVPTVEPSAEIKLLTEIRDALKAR